MRKLVVVEDVVLQSAFPELLPGGPTARQLRVPVWWPTQTNRLGDGGALGPHVVARGGIQKERRRGALADEAVHGKHFTGEKHLLRVKRMKKKQIFMIQTVTPLFFLETNLLLTFPCDFCVSMIGKSALRCKNAESRDVLHEQLKRSEAPRSGTRNGQREKEHTSTVDMELPKVE